MKRFLAALTVLSICTMAFGFIAASSLTETAQAKPPGIYLDCPYFPNDCTRGSNCTYYEPCPGGQRAITTDGHCNSTPNCCGAVVNIGPCL